MFKTKTRATIISLIAGLGLAFATGCDAPEEAEAPVVEQTDEAEEAPGAQEGDEQAQLQLDDPPEPALGEAPEGEAPAGQPPGGDQAPNPMAAQGGEVTDEDLDQFAEAVEAVNELEEEVGNPQQRMQEAESQQEAQQIQQELMGQLQQAVQESGMSFPEFMMMSQQIGQDPELQQKLEERVDIEDLGGGPGAQQQGGAPPAPGDAPSPAEGSDDHDHEH